MANPQPECGYLKLANEIVEALERINLSPYEWRVMLCILRHTYGWNKKSDSISFSQFEQDTGIKRRHIQRTLKSLKDRNIIWMIHKGEKTVVEYGFQKNYNLWEGLLPLQVTDEPMLLPLQVTDKPELAPVEVTDEENQSITSTGIGLLPTEVTELAPVEVNTKDNKDNIQKTYTSKDASDKQKLLFEESVKKVFEGLKERRGIPSPQAAAEAVAIRWMLKHGFTVEQIMKTHDHLKNKPFWEDKFLNMQSVKSQINDVLKEASSNGKGPKTNSGNIKQGYNSIPDHYTDPDEIFWPGYTEEQSKL